MSGNPNGARGSLDDVRAALAVVETGGFRAAARRLGVGASRVSEAVRRLEDRLGTRLFERTTRAVVPTEAGRRLAQGSREALEALDEALAGAAGAGNALSGRLRIGAPVAAGPLFLDALVARFAHAHPDVDVDLRYDDRRADALGERLDLVVRARALLELDSHSLPVGPPVETALVAAPDYLERHGHPTDPDELASHDGLYFRAGSDDGAAPWRFSPRADDAVGSLGIALPRRRLLVDSLPSLVAHARAGLGVAYVYRASVTHALADGALVEVLPGLCAPLPSHHLGYLSRRHLPARVAAFVTLARTTAALPAPGEHLPGGHGETAWRRMPGGGAPERQAASETER